MSDSVDRVLSQPGYFGLKIGRARSADLTATTSVARLQDEAVNIPIACAWKRGARWILSSE